MMLTNLSTCVSVEEFFTQANWRGLKPDLNIAQSQVETVKSINVDEIQTPRLSLSVENFFAYNNWRGLKQVSTPTVKEAETVVSYIGMTPSLTMSVGEFFQRMVWQGQKKLPIATMPKIKTPENLKPQPESLNVNDLSDLF